MAATGKTPILLYGSTTPTNAPSAGNLTNSSDGCEIAINVADKNLFFKDATNAVNTVPIRQSSGSSDGWLSSANWTTFNSKQAALVSGTNIKTVNGTTLLGSGDLGTIGTGYGGTGLTSFTANGVVYASSTSALATGSALQFNGSNLGINVAPSSWSSAFKGIDMPSAGFVSAQTQSESLTNAYYDGSNWIYKTSTNATRYLQLSGAHRWYYATSGTAGNTITFTEGLSLGNTGNVTVSTGNLVIGTSGKGIDFSATAGTGTSELLADYEEGTFTPTVVGTTTAGTASYNAQKGVYTKIGNVVYISIALNWNSGTGTGNLRFSGLPYTSRNDSTLFSALSVYNSNLALPASNVLAALISSNSTQVTFYSNVVGGGAGAALAYDAAAEIECSGFYFV